LVRISRSDTNAYMAALDARMHALITEGGFPEWEGVYTRKISRMKNSACNLTKIVNN
jgi:hypothetical protein